MPTKKIRVVVIDDSAFNRQTITSMLESNGEFEVIGRAGDGEEGLKLVFQTQPDVITLDLEMPKMDGFSFLRILMAKRPTPVIVVSGYSTRENVFKALELGALDFVAKPSRNISPELKGIKEELTTKMRVVTQLRMVSLTERAEKSRTAGTSSGSFGAVGAAPPSAFTRKDGPAPNKLIAIGASTGGPPAIHQILASLDPGMGAGIVITQHMPAKFTRAFAERLGRTTPWAVREAETGDAVTTGTVLVAPGSGSLTVRKEGNQLRATIEAPAPEDRFVPSIDKMMVSTAEAMGTQVLGVILTGMGGDGGRGVRAIKGAGGRVICEAPETAVIFGMPQEAINTGAVDDVLPLSAVPDAIHRFAKRG